MNSLAFHTDTKLKTVKLYCRILRLPFLLLFREGNGFVVFVRKLSNCLSAYSVNDVTRSELPCSELRFGFLVTKSFGGKGPPSALWVCFAPFLNLAMTGGLGSFQNGYTSATSGGTESQKAVLVEDAADVAILIDATFRRRILELF